MWAEWLLVLLAGAALSAAAGFRVFVPLLIVGLAVRADQIVVAEEMLWLGSTPALVVFGVATILEVGAVHVPWLDHALDVLALPAAAIAGAVLSASFVVDVEPWLRWTLVAVSGGGLASGTHLAMATVRFGSTSLTAGLGNPVVAAMETGFAVVATLLVVVVPIVAALGFAVLVMSAGPWLAYRVADLMA